MKAYRNSEGYPDPTPGGAFANIARYEAERKAVIKRLIPLLKQTAELAGFEITSRITFTDKATGRRYR